MPEKIGVLGVSYGVRANAMMDAINRSPGYDSTFFIYDKQKNPFNLNLARETGGDHVVGNLNDVDAIVDFAKQHRGKIDFAVVGPEDPIIAGLGNRLYEETGIVALCPWKEYAIENSKIRQREIIQKACPDANPDFMIFRRTDYKGLEDPDLRRDFSNWYRSQNGMVAIKPDSPDYGAGVVVAGDHFDPDNEDEAFALFKNNFKNSDVLVEEKLNLEEFSGQYMSDGKTLVELPYTRDFKRRLDGDRGFNTGGMATLKGIGDLLPFMVPEDREKAWRYANKIFDALKAGDAFNPGLLGIPMYIAFAITDRGLKILEINSRFGDPEGPTVVPLSEMSYAEVCMRIKHGELVPLDFDERAGLLLYKVPPNYGGIDAEFKDKRVDLSAAYRMAEKLNSKKYPTLLVYPGSMELKDSGETHALSSRTVASIGYGDSIESAAQTSLSGILAIGDHGLDYRNDPVDMLYWEGVSRHADELRARAVNE